MSRAFLLAVALVVAAEATPALANDFCNQEMLPLVQQRETLQKRLEAINKNPKQEGARERFCATMGEFIANLRKTQTYMVSNQEFCQIPPEAVKAVANGISGATKTRRRICSAPAAAPQGGPGGAQAIPKPPVELRLK